MRPADIYRLHYESAFAHLNPGKPLVLPPSGFGSRVLPAPGSASAPDTAAAIRQTTSSNAAYAAVRSAPEAAHFDRVHPQPAAVKPIIVEVSEPTRSASMTARGSRDAYQRSYIPAQGVGAAPIQDAVSVDANDVPADAKITVAQTSTAKATPKPGTPAWARRFHFGRQTMLVAGALALGIGATSLFFAHPDPHAIALAWGTYKAAMAAHPDRDALPGRTTAGNAPHPTSEIPGTSTSNLSTATQQNAVNPVEAARSTAGITIPHAPNVAPRALTSQDLMPDPQGTSPLGNVSPDALRRPTDFSVQNVTVDSTTTSPVNVYESPIRKPLKALHHPVEPTTDAEPAQAHPAHASEEANPKKNARPTAADVASPAAGKAPAQPAQQVRQDTNGDQKLF